MSGSTTSTTLDSDSIELSRNAKGQCSWSIKVYGSIEEDDLVASVEALDKGLRDKFGATQGGKDA